MYACITPTMQQQRRERSISETTILQKSYNHIGRRRRRGEWIPLPKRSMIRNRTQRVRARVVRGFGFFQLAFLWSIVAVFSLSVDRQGTAPPTTTTMVLSFCTRALTSRWTRRQLAITTKRRLGFGLSGSNLEDFFGGGDMDRLVQELSEEQQQQQQQITNSTCVSTARKGKQGWRQWQDISFETPTASSSSSASSPVEVRTIRGRTVYIKHDDQLRLEGSGISGNKARKMWTLNAIPPQDFPSCLVSYGGPQSNSMLALAAVVQYKNRQQEEKQQQTFQEAGNDNIPQNDNDDGKALKSDNGSNSSSSTPDLPFRFVYYTKKLPRFLRKQPNGNLFRALSLGMELVEVSPEEYAQLAQGEDTGTPPVALEAPYENALWVPQGGAFALAKDGALRLAREIYDYWKSVNPAAPLTVCVPGGTCTTALLLHHGLEELLAQDAQRATETAMDIRVLVVPCVGDANYARRQMMGLAAHMGASPEHIPTILQPFPEDSNSDNDSTHPKKYFSFGRPDKRILDAFYELQEDSNLLVDLLYGAPSFAVLWRHWNNEDASLSPDLAFDPKLPLAGRELMYVHSGGLEGINSQLLRYKYNGLVELQDVQLPGRPTTRSRPKTRRGNKKKKKKIQE